MKLSTVFGMVVISSLAIVVSASADDKNYKNRKQATNSAGQSQQRQFGSSFDVRRGNGSGIKNVLDVVQTIKKHHNVRDQRTTNSAQGTGSSTNGYQYDAHPIPPPVARGNGSVTVTVTDPNQKPRDNAIRGVGYPFIEIGNLHSTLNDHRKPKKNSK